jgi:ankyrin repeat protein
MTVEENVDGVSRLLQDIRMSDDMTILKRELSATDSSGKTALMIASANGSERIVDILLENGADPSLAKDSGETALHFAMESGFFRTAQVLIKGGADVSKENARLILEDGDCTPQGDLERPGCDAGKPASAVPPNLPLLSKLSYEGKEEDVLRMIGQNSTSSSGYDIEEGADRAFTPFLLASMGGHLAIMRQLLSHGANINTTTKKGWTALMLASKRSDEECVRMLLCHGADVNHLSPDRWTALAEATTRGHIRLVELLLEAGADTETRSQHDWTPLMHAAYRGDIDSVNLLLGHGAIPAVGSTHDETPLLLACATGSLMVAKKLLEVGCAIEPAWASPGSHGMLYHHNEDQSSFMLDRAYQVGWTPMMLACQSGSKAIVELLLDRGASLAPRSPMFKTAYDIAKENGRTDIVEILEGRLDR